MASVSYWQGGWVSGGESEDLQPGETHGWIMWGFNYGDSINLTAHPITGDPNAQRILEVQDVACEGDVSGRRLFFSVKNVGPDSVPGYAIGYGYISE